MATLKIANRQGAKNAKEKRSKNIISFCFSRRPWRLGGSKDLRLLKSNLGEQSWQF
jgi:hypothetical protein